MPPKAQKLLDRPPLDSLSRQKSAYQLDKSDQSVDDQALKAWWKQIDQWRGKKCLAVAPAEGGIIKPQQAIQALYELTEGDAFISSDVG